MLYRHCHPSGGSVNGNSNVSGNSVRYISRTERDGSAQHHSGILSYDLLGQSPQQHDRKTRLSATATTPSPTLAAPASRCQQHYQNQNPHRSPASSLILSAARSVLDDATPNTALSETGSAEYYFGYDSRSLSNRPELSSLQMKRMPALPDEQDRKRFIGCLATILASSYDYDEPDESVLENEAYKDSLLYSVGQDDVIATTNANAQHDNVETASYATHSSFEYTDVDEIMSESTDDGASSIASASSAPAAPALASNSYSRPSNKTQQTQQKRPSVSASASITTRAASASVSASTRQSIWGSNAGAKALLAQQRHRKRRYHVLSTLLVQSAELLLLDSSAAKAFLPMLDRVLNPQPTAKHSTKPPLARGDKDKARDSRIQKQVSSKGGKSTVRQTFQPAEKVPASDDDPAVLPAEFVEDGALRAFLESMTPGSGIRCLSLLLLQYLITSEVGYDARIRHAVRKLGVIVLVRDMQHDPVEPEIALPSDASSYCLDPLAEKLALYNAMFSRATRKFESLEHSIARRIIRLSESSVDAVQKQKQKQMQKKHQQGTSDEVQSNYTGLSRQQILRGVKIGSAGIVAGTLFALTGGLAAPGIAAGVAAIAGSTAATAAVVTLTSTAVVTTIFGVGGGGLAAYKMQRRTQGLSEFEIRKESTNGKSTNSAVEAELFSTICLSGWLRDKFDYQRPWGVHPTNPRLTDRVELLERFYSVHSPEHVPKCVKILASWKGEEDKLWRVLREKYGTDPDHLFPLNDGPRVQGSLTLEQEEVLDQIFVELGYNSTAPTSQPDGPPSSKTRLSTFRTNWKERRHQAEQPKSKREWEMALQDILQKQPASPDRLGESLRATASTGDDSAVIVDLEDDQSEFKPPKHLTTVWDYQSTYGGELYTIRWESQLLKTICDYVMDLAMDVVSGATRHLLKQTVLNALLSAFTWPSYLVNVANMIDGDWTLAVERSDEAGKELARTLLFSRAGHRPVTLIGFSFGARIIYSCLKELAKFQEDWEEYQQQQQLQQQDDPMNSDNPRLRKMSQTFQGMREPASIIEDVVLMGLPNHLSLQSWRACRQVVAGRLIHCYSRNDLILSLMFQVKRLSVGGGGGGGSSTSSVLKPVCGTCPVLAPGVENVDVSDLITGHEAYCLLTRQVLERVRHGEPYRNGAGVVVVS